MKKVLVELLILLYNTFRCVDGLSPNGKATDSDSVISRFESLDVYKRQVLRVRIIIVYVLNARVSQGWSTTLPRWGPRVRIPSRAFFIFSGSLYFQRFPLFFIFSPALPSKAKLLLRSFQIPGNPALQKEFPARKMR